MVYIWYPDNTYQTHTDNFIPGLRIIRKLMLGKSHIKSKSFKKDHKNWENVWTNFKFKKRTNKYAFRDYVIFLGVF